ncbi:MAG: hypothetical protein ACOCWZ_12640, partial [Spirochaetota bacterium]
MAVIVGALAFCYVLYYFNYLETPSADYMNNFLPRVKDYMNGNFPGSSFKILPVYNLLLALLTPLNPLDTFDPVYLTAIIVNLILFIPYLAVVWALYRRWLGAPYALVAMLFLSANIYTVYTAINGELEMLLTLLIALTIYFTVKNSRLAYLTSWLAAGTKWDAVFTVPAAMYRDFFENRKKILSIVLGALASTIAISWILLIIYQKSGAGNHTYVGEIAQRGPNIYMFFIDCFLVASSFVAWMGTHIYFSDIFLIQAVLALLLLVFGILVLVLLVWGGILFIRLHWRTQVPLLLATGGFLLVHVVYQNTKARYVLPVLWLLNLFLFYGLQHGIIPFMGKKWSNINKQYRKKLAITTFTLGLAVFTFASSFTMLEAGILPYAWALAFTAAGVITVRFTTGAGNNIILASALVFGILFSFMTGYGSKTMDHYSLRRVEFKKAGMWYKNNGTKDDRMLISETNVAMYYSGLGRNRFIQSKNLPGNTMQGVVEECTRRGITLVFIDDFYIRRLKVRDKNALMRNAATLKMIRENAADNPHFIHVKTFITGHDIRSHLYRFIPEKR